MSETPATQTALTPSNRRLIMIAAIVVGIILVIVAVVYFLNPANGLPVFFPGYSLTATVHHWKHGLLSLILGIGAFVLAWFMSSSPQKQ